MARWGIADNGDVLELAGSDATVASVVEVWSPPRGIRWRMHRPAGRVTCRIELDGSVSEADERDARPETVRGSPSAPSRVDDSDPDGRIEHYRDDGAFGRRVDDRPRPASPAGEVRVWVDGIERRGGLSAAESAIGLFAAERLVDVVAVHAAVLVVNGGAVLVPGASYSGKSTLCAAALDVGVPVWSDEYALVHADGAVAGWTRPLRLRTSHGVVRLDLESTTSTRERPLVPVLVASLRYSPRGWDVVNATEAEAIESLLANTVCATRRPLASFHAAVSVAQSATRLRGTRGEADEAVSRLCDALRSPSATQPG